MTKRVALCLSGQPRSFREAFPFIKQNLLEKEQEQDIFITVFMHVWGPWSSNMLELKMLYVPYTGAFLFNEQDRREIPVEKYSRISSPKHPPINAYQMYYSIFKANMLKKEYEMEHKVLFDYVIRSRFDFALNRTLPFEEIKPGKIYVPNTHNRPSRDFCNDQFAFGDSIVMDLYSNTFVNLDHLYHGGCIFNAEELLSENLKMYGLVGDNLVYIDMNDPFPPGKYNGTPHSLIRDDFCEWNKLRG